MKTHRIISLNSFQEQNNNLLQPFIVRPNYNIYFSLAKITNKGIQFFCILFAHFHTSTMVPSKALITSLPIAQPRTNPVGMSPWSSEVFFKTKKLPSLAGKKEMPKLYHPPCVPRRCPGGRPTGKQMITA